MKFALVNGERREAEKGIEGLCTGCEQLMIPKCGPIKIKHWAHKSKCICDRWWENETEWHRTWKNNFPVEAQEIRHRAECGEWHIADVKTKQGHILEFQHSFLNQVERQARNNFYGNSLVWVVDGLRRKKDREQFDAILKKSKQIAQGLQMFRFPALIDECSILMEWAECAGPIFFDFGAEAPLWCLFPKSSKGNYYVGPFPRQIFIDLHNGLLTKNGQSFSELMQVLNDIIFAYENPQQSVGKQSPTIPLRPPVQRQIIIPQNLSRRDLYYLNHSPRRKVRF